ncbi:hypothetical protein ACFWNW_17610 [Streptomyces seoulensis]|uniref:hypothetical protein n=1 Tax=Streptomyces seoulensis TaxID=73044 RepID=UPI003652BC77
MVTSAHEGMHRIFEERPEILAPHSSGTSAPCRLDHAAHPTLLQSGRTTCRPPPTGARRPKSAGMEQSAAQYFSQFLDTALGTTPAGEKWRNIVSFVNYFPGRGTLLERTFNEGTATGEAKGVLSVLKVRGIPVPDHIREQITSCLDPVRVSGWLELAETVERAEDLFTDTPEAPESV